MVLLLFFLFSLCLSQWFSQELFFSLSRYFVLFLLLYSIFKVVITLKLRNIWTLIKILQMRASWDVVCLDSWWYLFYSILFICLWQQNTSTAYNWVLSSEPGIYLSKQRLFGLLPSHYLSLIAIEINSIKCIHI